MSLIIQQNTPTIVDLANEARSTGWSLLPNGTAHHETCNSGYITIKDILIVPVEGNVYTVSYQVIDYVSGQVVLHVGDSTSTPRMANGNYVDTLTATGANPEIRLFSDGKLTISLLDVKTNTESTFIKQRNTIDYDEIYNKWPSFKSYTSDFGFSFFTDVFTFKNGRLYKHDPELLVRNNVYGVQYETAVNLPMNGNQGQPKTFESLSYESNMLLVTTTDGIKTSLGQVSELISEDFVQQDLIDGATEVIIYNREGIYSASFLRDKNEDINFGSVLKGTSMSIELITTETGVLKLKNVVVNSVPSKIGTR